MKEEIFQIPSEISKVVSMSNRSLRIVCDTQENLTDEQMAKAMGLLQKRGWLTVSVEPVQPDDLLKLPKLTYDKDEVSPSLRYRNVLYVLWEKDKPTPTFEEFYHRHYEKLINAIKERLT